MKNITASSATVRATLRYAKITPRKMRAVGDMVRGLHVSEAEAQLLFMRRRPARPLLKLLRSALANADSSKLQRDKLCIVELRVDQGPMLKRHLPRARGSASPLQKKMSHVTIVLAEKAGITKPRFVVPVVRKEKKAATPQLKSKKGKPAAPEHSAAKSPAARPAGAVSVWRKVFSRKTAGA